MVSKCLREGEGIGASILLSPYEASFSLHRNYFINHNGGNLHKWVQYLFFKFNDDPTVNDYGIIVLLGQVWVYMGKRKLHAREISLTIDIISHFTNSNSENVRQWVPNLVFKFYNDSTVNDSMIISLLG